MGCEWKWFHFWATFLKRSCILAIPLFPCADWTVDIGMEVGDSLDEAEKDSTRGLYNQQDTKNLSFTLTWRRRVLHCWPLVSVTTAEPITSLINLVSWFSSPQQMSRNILEGERTWKRQTQWNQKSRPQRQQNSKTNSEVWGHLVQSHSKRPWEHPCMTR